MTPSVCLKKSTLFVTLVLLSAMLAATAFASVPVTMTQQGKLLDDDGEPLTGEQTLLFGIYDAASGGDLLWSDEITVDLGDSGVYTARLGGEDNPIDATVLQDGQTFLELTVGSDAMEPRLEMTSVPFASIAQRAEVAESVADGSITSDSLAPGAVTAEAVDSISWDQLTDVPDEISEPADTLQQLDCSSDELAIYSGDGWTCGSLPSYSGHDFALSDQSCSDTEVAVGINSDGSLLCDDQIDTTYTAGDGLTLSDDEFSVAEDSFLPCSSSTCPQGDASRLYYDANTGGNFWVGRAGNELATGTDLGVGGDLSTDGELSAGGDLSTDGNLEVSNRSRFDNRISIQQDADENPDAPVHIAQNSLTLGLLLESREWDSVTHYWNLSSYDDFGTNAGSFEFRHREDDDAFAVRARIDPEDGTYSQVSDARLKEDVHHLDGVLSDILDLQPAEYRMIHQDRDSDPRLGMMAQQVAEVFPQLVTYDEREDLYTIAYSGFSVLAIQAIREQQDIIDAKNRRVDTLESQVDELEQRLQQIEEQL